MYKIIAEAVSQALAFLLFFLVLKKYAWGPILRLIDERNAKIEEAFKRAEAAEEKAVALRAEYEAHMRNVEAEAREKIQAAVNEGRRIATEINDNARKESARILDKAKQATELELAKARAELKEEIVGMVVGATEKIIRSTFDEARHRAQIEDFVQELSHRQ